MNLRMDTVVTCGYVYHHLLARDYEQLPAVLAGRRFLVFARLILHQVIQLSFRS